jgi:hypothetical protein
MAAQDYFSRLQMSGMVHPDMANFAALGGLNLNSMHNSSPSASSSSGNKHNLKRKDKSSQDDKYNNSKDASRFESS